MVGSEKFNPAQNLDARKGYMQKHRWHEKYVLREEDQAEWERLKREAQRKKEIQARLSSFHKGSMNRSGTRLTCHISGMSFANAELSQGFEAREQVIRHALALVGIPDEVIQFTPPAEPVPNPHVKADDIEGESGDVYRQAALRYTDQARKNYNASMSVIMEYADKNLAGGANVVNRAVAESQREVRWVSEKAAATLEVPEEWGYPGPEERKRLFHDIDKNGNGFLSLAELDLAVRTQWPGFNHREALIRAYKLADMKSGADGKKDGFLSWSDDEKKCEFSRFLKYLQLYVEYWDKFARIDLDQDRCLERDEWKMRAGTLFPGVVLSEADLELIFDELDADGGGRVRFDEFCAWAAKTFGDMELQEATQLRSRQFETFHRARATKTWRQGPGESLPQQTYDT
eukprot:Hpha_TRINITY_DN10476_c0_g1::TRINITY_DN10476_c0_g1_i1::g.193552::m.193552